MELSSEHNTLLAKLYGQIISSSQGFEADLADTTKIIGLNDHPAERAILKNLQQTLGELATVARIGAARTQQ